MGAAFVHNGTETRRDVSSEYLMMFHQVFASIYNHKWKMNPSLHTWNKRPVKTMGLKGRISSKER